MTDTVGRKAAGGSRTISIAVHSGRAGMATKLDDISEAIGELRAEVKNLGQKIDRADQNALDTSNKAAERRSAIHKRVEEIADEVG